MRSRRVQIVLACAVVVVIAVAVYAVTRPEDEGSQGPQSITYKVPSEAMEPSFSIGEEVSVNVEDTAPEFGEVIVFHPPEGADIGKGCGVPREPGRVCPEPTAAASDGQFLKRVVAEPGDELSIRDGLPVVSGETELADVMKPCTGGAACELPKPVTIPPDHYFVMGDNTGVSEDSRFWGPVKAEWIIGTVEP